jgi:1,4-alpha-glucan branching enzyme
MTSAHAAHFASLLATIAATHPAHRRGVVVAPFDTELFGHWWYEGTEFLGNVYRALSVQPSVRPVTASHHLATFRARTGLRLAAGSWGANGDDSMWLNSQTAWTWPRIWDLEERFWTLAREAIELPSAYEALAQAARELLLVQSSDWQFIISTGAAADYGERRFREHCSETEELVHALVDGSPEALERGSRRAAELGERDAIFPDVLPAISAALAGSRSLPIG